MIPRSSGRRHYFNSVIVLDGRRVGGCGLLTWGSMAAAARLRESEWVLSLEYMLQVANPHSVA